MSVSTRGDWRMIVPANYRPSSTELASRLDLIEQDLDCDCVGSLAQTLANLHKELLNLRAMIEELRT